MVKEKRSKLFLILILLIFVTGTVSAADVAYIYNKNFKIDNNIINVFKELNLTVDKIQESKIFSTNFSKYKLLFVGDERFTEPKKIPVNKYPTIVTNYYHGPEWGLTDADGYLN